MTSAVTEQKDHDSVDLSALGKDYTSPRELDTSPEVSDVIAKLPWWAARSLLYIIVSFVLVALVWASLSKVDVVVESRGSLVPEGYVKPVQSINGGVVQNVFVREGDTVARGQPIIQLEAAEMRARLDKLHQELTTSETQLRQLMVSRPVTETLEQQNRLARLQTEIAGAELSLQHTTITAPFSGLITTLETRSAGAVLQPGQTIATISPAGAPLIVEARLANKDVAFIEKGLHAKLKFDAFPFQDYGTVGGTVTGVSTDARIDKQDGSYYQVTIAPQQTEMIARGRHLPLRPGLAVTAEIVTERKSVLSLLLEPFRQLKGATEANH